MELADEEVALEEAALESVLTELEDELEDELDDELEDELEDELLDVVAAAALEVDEDVGVGVALVVLEVTVAQFVGGEMPFREFLISTKYGVPQSQSLRELVASYNMMPPNWSSPPNASMMLFATWAVTKSPCPEAVQSVAGPPKSPM